MVEEGVVRKDSPIRVLRDSVVIYEGELESLRRFKDDVKEVKSGTECVLVCLTILMFSQETRLRCLKELKELARSRGRY